MRVLDVASGTGLGSQLLHAYGAELVVGAESDPDALRHVRPAPSGLSFVRADAQALPFADASFDAVVSFETIEHLADARALLAECRRVLREEGLLYLSTPNRTVTRCPSRGSSNHSDILPARFRPTSTTYTPGYGMP